jgi:gliding motility-associated protein GldC
MSRTAEIKLNVDLDGDDLPTHIEWEASEARGNGPQPSQSILLSLWDSDSKTAAAINLWTKDMTVEDMNLFYYEVFHRMADSYTRATKNTDVGGLIHAFGDDFGHALGMLPQDVSERDNPMQDDPVQDERLES